MDRAFGRPRGVRTIPTAWLSVIVLCLNLRQRWDNLCLVCPSLDPFLLGHWSVGYDVVSVVGFDVLHVSPTIRSAVF